MGWDQCHDSCEVGKIGTQQVLDDTVWNDYDHAMLIVTACIRRQRQRQQSSPIHLVLPLLTSNILSIYLSIIHDNLYLIIII